MRCTTRSSPAACSRTNGSSKPTSSRNSASGRAAIRTALIRLEQEDLVEREPNRGARVRMISLPMAIEILQAREVLEGLTAGRAAERITSKDAAALRGDLAAQRKQLDGGDLLAASDANAAFHRRIVTIAGTRPRNG